MGCFLIFYFLKIVLTNVFQWSKIDLYHIKVGESGNFKKHSFAFLLCLSENTNIALIRKKDWRCRASLELN